MDNEQKKEINILDRYKVRMIKWAITAVVLVVLMLVVFFKGYSNGAKNSAQTDKTTTVITIDLIKSEIKDIGELATIEYLYTNAAKFEDPKQIFGVNIPFTTKSFIAKWDGIIKAGVKIDKIIVEINDRKKEIIVHMPKAEILSHEIDNNSIETLDEEDGLFNKIKIEDVRSFDAISKDEMEQRAKDNGILDKAFENAKEIIERLVNNDIVQEQGYVIKFEVIE